MRATIATAIVGLLMSIQAAAAPVTALAPPTNLQVVATTEDSITVAWGPSQPSDFKVLAVYKNGNAILLGWKFSEDTRGPVTYTVTKNGVDLVSGLSLPQYRIGGLHRTASFRVCVTATSVAGPSAASCGTVSRA